MVDPINLIEIELEHRQRILKDLKERVGDEEKRMLNTTAEIQTLKNEMGILKDAIALLKGGDKGDGK